MINHKRLTKNMGVTCTLAALLALGVPKGEAGMADIKLYGQFGTGTPAIEGNFVEDLTSASAFPDNPALDSANPPDFFPIEPITSLEWPQPFQEGDNTGDDYGSMVEGYLEVPADGDYQFYIRSDDGSQFELSSDDSAGNAEVIAEVPGDACCSAFVTDGTRNSDPITLQKGEQYYFRVLHKEGTGGDWWQVGWSGPEIGDDPTVIAGRYIQRFVTESGAPVITQQPEDQSIPEEDIATTDAVFSVAVDAAPSVDYQWLENGTPIDGAISSSYSFQASLEDDGNEYSVEISNGDGSVTSEVATLTVTPDTTSPTLVEANHRGNPNGVRVRFSEQVDEASATNLDNYTLDGGSLEVTSAELVEDGRAVQLGGDWNFELESSHTIEVSGVTDRAATPNTISPDPASANFTYVGGQGVTYDFNEGLPDNLEIFGDAEVRSSGSYDGSGFLSVNDGEGDQLGAALFTDRLDVSQVKFTFKMRVGDTSDNPADGFSFNVADDLPEGTYPQSEEGYNATTGTVDADGLMVAFDNWDSGGDDNSPSVAVKYDGEVKGEVELPGAGSGTPVVEDELPSIHRGDEWFDVEIDVRPDGSLFMTYDGYTIFDGLQTGFDGIQNAQVGFGGRTGGAWESHWIDDLNVNFEGGEVGPIAIAEGEQPEDKLDVPEHEEVTLDVETSGSIFGLSFQWMKDGEPIEGATTRTLTFTASPDREGEYSVLVKNDFSEATSESAQVTVVPDNESPALTDVQASGSFDGVTLSFSEPITQESAENLDNYSIVTAEGGETLEITGATLQGNDMDVVLSTGSQSEGTVYDLTVNGITDRAAAANQIAADTMTQFSAWATSRYGVKWEAYTGIGGTAVSALTDADKYPDSPDEVRSLSSFDMGGGGSFFGDNYGARMTALFYPPETGDYRFFVRSDDASQLFISTDGTEEGLGSNPIAEETGCCNAFQGPDQPQTSDVISLTEGEPVLLRYLMKEGGGGDWAQVAFRMEGDETAPGDLAPIPGQYLEALQPVPQEPVLQTQTPASGAQSVANDASIQAVLRDGIAAVDESTVEVTVDGETVEASVTRDGSFVTVDATPASPLGSLKEIPIEISYTDSQGNERSVGWSFNSALDVAGTFVEGTRFIEAEDYNYESGQWVEDANGGPTGEPYAGGEYEGLEGVNGVDFNDGGGGGGEPAYRFDVATDQPGPATTAFEKPEDLDRGSFEVESNWKVGWTGEGEWLNFTRDFPAEEQTYDVYARISSGGTDPNPTLQRVTGDPTQEDQSVEQLGQFSGAASGDWGTAIFYKMHEIDNPDAPAQVSLSGENTIRLTVGSGNMDWDYLAFVPAEPAAEETVLSISFADGNVEVSWDTGASLQTAPSVTGPWEASDQSSPATFSVEDSDSLFIRAVE